MERICCTISVAGTAVELQSRFDHRPFFRDYLTDDAPQLTIRPEQADLEKIRRQFEAEHLPGEAPDYTEPFLENNAIHMLLAETLAARGALLVHGSAIAVDGETYLFTAKSGTGKSTHARLWREKLGERATMVNDDKPFLLVKEEGVFACGTPWNGKHRLGENIILPLKALIRLERGEENRIAPLSPAEMLPTLYNAAYRSDDAQTMAAILDLEDAILRRTALYALWCNTDPSAADVAYDGMNK